MFEWFFNTPQGWNIPKTAKRNWWQNPYLIFCQKWILSQQSAYKLPNMFMSASFHKKSRILFYYPLENASIFSLDRPFQALIVHSMIAFLQLHNAVC